MDYEFGVVEWLERDPVLDKEYILYWSKYLTKWTHMIWKSITLQHFRISFRCKVIIILSLDSTELFISFSLFAFYEFNLKTFMFIDELNFCDLATLEEGY